VHVARLRSVPAPRLDRGPKDGTDLQDACAGFVGLTGFGSAGLVACARTRSSVAGLLHTVTTEVLGVLRCQARLANRRVRNSRRQPFRQYAPNPSILGGHLEDGSPSRMPHCPRKLGGHYNTPDLGPPSKKKGRWQTGHRSTCSPRRGFRALPSSVRRLQPSQFSEGSEFVSHLPVSVLPVCGSPSVTSISWGIGIILRVSRR